MIASTAETTRTGCSAGRVALRATGTLAGLLALALLVGGGALVWSHGTKRDADGFYAGGSRTLTTPTYALVSEGLDVGVGGPDFLFGQGRLGTVRVTATGSAAHPIFVGIGPVSRVNSYLRSVAHDAVTDFAVDPFTVTSARRAGDKAPLEPATQNFWAAKSSGRGRQSMTWPVAKGNWAVVVMNADAARSDRTHVGEAARVRFDVHVRDRSTIARGASRSERGRPSTRRPHRPRIEADHEEYPPRRRPEWSRNGCPVRSNFSGRAAAVAGGTARPRSAPELPDHPGCVAPLHVGVDPLLEPARRSSSRRMLSSSAKGAAQTSASASPRHSPSAARSVEATAAGSSRERAAAASATSAPKRSASSSPAASGTR